MTIPTSQSGKLNDTSILIDLRSQISRDFVVLSLPTRVNRASLVARCQRATLNQEAVGAGVSRSLARTRSRRIFTIIEGSTLENHPFVLRIIWLAILVGSLSLVGIAFTRELPKIWPHAEMQWTRDAALPSVQSVLLWGNPQAGEHAMLRKFPAGYAPPPHKHPSTERVVVISGALEVNSDEAGSRALGPGSYSEIPAGVVHAVKCAAQSDCEFLLAAPGAFAIIPADR